MKRSKTWYMLRVARQSALRKVRVRVSLVDDRLVNRAPRPLCERI
jgi:hypothetical protein